VSTRRDDIEGNSLLLRKQQTNTRKNGRGRSAMSEKTYLTSSYLPVRRADAMISFINVAS